MSTKNIFRFKVGDVVYLKSDLKNKVPMTIIEVLKFDKTDDYIVEWLSPAEIIKRNSFPDAALKT